MSKRVILFYIFFNYSEEFVVYNDEFIEVKWNEMKVAQLCLTHCDPMDYAVAGILQARTLEWVAFPFSRGSSRLRDRTALQADSLPAEPPGKPNVFIISKLNKKLKNNEITENLKKKIDTYIPSSSPEIPLNFCEKEPRNSQFEKV